MRPLSLVSGVLFLISGIGALLVTVFFGDFAPVIWIGSSVVGAGELIGGILLIAGIALIASRAKPALPQTIIPETGHQTESYSNAPTNSTNGSTGNGGGGAPFQITAKITCYLLPDDGKAAEQEFLNHISDPGETYIIAYGFTLVPMIDDLIAAHKKGVPIHIFLDHTQSEGTMQKPQVQRLVDAGLEVTIGTSPAGSKYICHTKGVVSDDNPAWCWEGSTNFSQSAWNQVNTAMVFSSQQWYDNFVAQFKRLRQFAWSNERQFQVMKNPPQAVK